MAAFEKYVEEKKVETTEVVKSKGADNTTNINKVDGAVD